MVRANPYLNSRSMDYRFRKKRYEIVKAMIDQSLAHHNRCRIIDIGGSETYWNIAADHIADPRIQIDIVNRKSGPTEKRNVKALTGDACSMSEYDDMSYDIAHSNSVIEHVGTWTCMSQMAANVRRLAPAYFVQTPYVWFPYEPHFRAPFFHWLPESWRHRLIMSRDMGYVKKAPTLNEAMRLVQYNCLLDRSQFATLFPDAEVKFETFFALPKSLLAVRQERA